jgi:outer membrane protein OmpA-like peptidoglycan-associated protein
MDNPTVKIEIEGHTDNQGTPDYNLKLSDNRARIVYEFLIAKSVSPDRLKYKGYGQNSPVEDNSTEAGRAKNRRTVLRIF